MSPRLTAMGVTGATGLTSPSSMVGCMLAPVARNRTQEPRRSSSAVRSGKMAGESGGIGEIGEAHLGVAHKGDHVLIGREAQLIAGYGLHHLIENTYGEVEPTGVVKGREAAGDQLRHGGGRTESDEAVGRPMT